MKKQYIFILCLLGALFFSLTGKNTKKGISVHPKKIIRNSSVKADIVNAKADSTFIVGIGTMDDPLRLSDYAQRKFTKKTFMEYSNLWVNSVTATSSVFLRNYKGNIYKDDIVKFPNGIMKIYSTERVNIGDTVYSVSSEPFPYDRLATLLDIRGKTDVSIPRDMVYYFDPKILMGDSIFYLMCGFEGRLAKIPSFDNDSIHFTFPEIEDTLSIVPLKDTVNILFSPNAETKLLYNNLDFSKCFSYKILKDNIGNYWNKDVQVNSLDFSHFTVSDFSPSQNWGIFFDDRSQYSPYQLLCSNTAHSITWKDGDKTYKLAELSGNQIKWYTFTSIYSPFVFGSDHKLLCNSNPRKGYFTNITSTGASNIPSYLGFDLWKSTTIVPNDFYFYYDNRYFKTITNKYGTLTDTVLNFSPPVKYKLERIFLNPVIYQIPANIKDSLDVKNGHKDLYVWDKFENGAWGSLNTEAIAKGYENTAYTWGTYVSNGGQVSFIATTKGLPEWIAGKNCSKIPCEKIVTVEPVDSASKQRKIAFPIIPIEENSSSINGKNYSLSIQSIRGKNIGEPLTVSTVDTTGIHFKQAIIPIFPIKNPSLMKGEGYGLYISLDYNKDGYGISNSALYSQKSPYALITEEVANPKKTLIDRIWAVDENAQHVEEGHIKPVVKIPITFIPLPGDKMKAGDYIMTYNHQVAKINQVIVSTDNGIIVNGNFVNSKEASVNYLKGINLNSIMQGGTRWTNFNDKYKIVDAQGNKIEDINQPSFLFDEDGRFGVHHGGGYFTTILNPKYKIYGTVSITPYISNDTMITDAFKTIKFLSTDRCICKQQDEPAIEFFDERGTKFRWGGAKNMLYSSDTTCQYICTFLNAWYNDPVNDTLGILDGSHPQHWGGRCVLVPYCNQVGVTHHYTMTNPKSHSYYFLPRKNWTGQMGLWLYDTAVTYKARDINGIPISGVYNVAESWNHADFDKINNNKNNLLVKSMDGIYNILYYIRDEFMFLRRYFLRKNDKIRKYTNRSIQQQRR